MIGRLVRDARGAAAIEFAIAAPVLLAMLIAVAQLGILYSANAGVHHSVEEGARTAAIFPTPSDADIRARVLATDFMLGNSRIDPQIAHGTTAEGDPYVDISLTYQVPLDFIFFDVGPVTVGHRRRVFRQVEPSGAPAGSPAGTPAGAPAGTPAGGGQPDAGDDEDLPRGNGNNGRK